MSVSNLKCNVLTLFQNNTFLRYYLDNNVSYLLLQHCYYNYIHTIVGVY